MLLTVWYIWIHSTQSLSMWQKVRVRFFFLFINKLLWVLMDSQFQTKELSPLRYFLEIEVTQSKNDIYLSQWKYLLDLLPETGVLGCLPSDTPIDITLWGGSCRSECFVLAVGCCGLFAALLPETRVRGIRDSIEEEEGKTVDYQPMRFPTVFTKEQLRKMRQHPPTVLSPPFRRETQFVAILTRVQKWEGVCEGYREVVRT